MCYINSASLEPCDCLPVCDDCREQYEEGFIEDSLCLDCAKYAFTCDDCNATLVLPQNTDSLPSERYCQECSDAQDGDDPDLSLIFLRLEWSK